MKYNTPPSAVLAQQLRDHFADTPELVEAVLVEPQLAPIDGVPGQTVPYVRLNEGASRPVLYTPGFGESVVNKVSFAAALAGEGFDVILPGQNRSRMRSAHGVNAAIATQTRNNLTVLRHAGAEDGVDMVSHSFGALVVPETVRLLEAESDGMSDAAVALLAPAGVGAETSYANIGWRWLKFIKSEWGPDDKAFPDTTGEAGKASVRALVANPRTTLAEVRSLRHEHVDFADLCNRVGRVAVVPYAEDEMYPQAFVEPGLASAFSDGPANLSAFSPVSFGPDGAGGLRRLPGAVHDDEQFNPQRVVPPLARFLRG